MTSKATPARLLDGKVALVTGSSSGVGRGSARAFARHGAKVMVTGRNAQGCEDTVGIIRSEGGEAAYHQADVTRAADVEGLVEAVVQKWGRLDCAFNVHGIPGPLKYTHEQTEADFDEMIASNLKGVWLCMKYEIAQMLKQGGNGAVVNGSSAASFIGIPKSAPYTAAKHGVAGLTRAAGLEYAAQGIRVNCVALGITKSPMTEALIASHPRAEEYLTSYSAQDRLAEPEEIGNAAVFLCSDLASFMNGTVMAVDAGQVAAGRGRV